jgi:hypothetical protein
MSPVVVIAVEKQRIEAEEPESAMSLASAPHNVSGSKVNASPETVVGRSRWFRYQNHTAAQFTQNLGCDLIDGLAIRRVVCELGVLLVHGSEDVRSIHGHVERLDPDA